MAGFGQTTSGGARLTFWQLVSSCFKRGSVATAVSRYSNQISERWPAKLAMSAASLSIGSSGYFTTKARCGSLSWFIPCLASLLLGHGGAIHQDHTMPRVAVPSD